MTLLTPRWLSGYGMSAIGDRQILSNLFLGGPVLNGDLAIGTTGTWGVTVAAGDCAIPGTDISNQGLYLCTNDTAITSGLTVPTAPGGSNLQWSRVIAKVVDKEALGNSSLTSHWEIDLISGTAATSPTKPSIPASAVSLFDVEVSHGDSNLAAAISAGRVVYPTRFPIMRTPVVSGSANISTMAGQAISTGYTGQDLMIQGGTTIANPGTLSAGQVALNGAGGFTIPFLAPFPTGLFTVVVCNGESQGLTITATPNTGSNNLGWSGIALLNGVAATSTVRINWIAIGW